MEEKVEITTICSFSLDHSEEVVCTLKPFVFLHSVVSID